MRNYSLQKKTPQDPSNYANIIFLDPTLGTDFVQEEVADEFARFLNHLTGQSFTIIQNQTLPSSGIMILKINSPAIKEAPQPVKDQFIKFKKGEKNSFLIFSDGTSRLWILAKTQEGLRHGMYYFLEKKGMRWYFPTDHWIISPQGISLASTINEFREPDFGRTNFEGVGGLEVLAPFPDPDKTHMPRKLWERWKKRNQWPAKPNLGGHTSNFNLCTQDINTDSFEGNIGELLRSDPLNLAQINGIRQRLPSAGFCTDGACIQKLAYTYHGQVSCENKKIPAMISYKGTLDRSGTQSHGQVLDAELQQTGGMDNSTCYGFNRRNGIIAKIGDLNNDSPFIICAWIKPNFSIHNRQKQFLFGFYGHNFREPAELSEFVIYHQPGTNMVCVNHGSTFSNGNPDTCKEMSSTPMIAPGQWTHVLARKWYTATNDRTYVELYVNDQLQRTIWHEGNIKIKPNVHKIHDFWIGGKNDITNGFSGDIDDVMVYNGTAWTREDIRHIYERDTGYREQDRILYLDFEENYQLCENPTDYQSYGGIVRLYTEWAKSRYRHFRFDMNNPNYTVQTIEPPDGRGHDTSLKSKNLLRFGPYGKYLTSAQQQQNSTISDRIFHFANEVTRHFKSAYPEADTSLLAYNEHAQVPSIPINANILVFIAPNAFHHRFTGKTSKQLMDAWHEKSRHNPYGRFDIGIYDYWSCADNIPRIPLSITNRIREWETRHFELFHLETAFSCGAVGLHLYLASKFVWDATMDDTRRDALIEEFYQKAFGPAQKPMARLLNRWYSGHFFLCEHELGVSYDDLIAAGKLARKAADVNLQKRINDFKLFLHFLRLVYENRFSNISRKQQLATHMWKMFDSLMVNSKDLCSNLYSETPNWETHPGYPFDAYYNLEIDDLIRDGDALYEPIPGLETARRSFSKDLIPLEAHMDIRDLDYMAPCINAAQTYAFYLQSDQDAVMEFSLSQGRTNQPARIQVNLYNSNSDQIDSDFFEQAAEGTVPKIYPNLETGLYFLEIIMFDTGQASRVIVKKDGDFHLVTVNRFQTRRYTPEVLHYMQNGIEVSHSIRAYFYVPLNTEMVYFSVFSTVGTPPELVDPTGSAVAVTEHGENMYSFNTGNQFGIWEIKAFNNDPGGPLRFYNIPNVISFSRDHMLVPREVHPNP